MSELKLQLPMSAGRWLEFSSALEWLGFASVFEHNVELRVAFARAFQCYRPTSKLLLNCCGGPQPKDLTFALAESELSALFQCCRAFLKVLQSVTNGKVLRLRGITKEVLTHFQALGHSWTPQIEALAECFAKECFTCTRLPSAESLARALAADFQAPEVLSVNSRLAIDFKETFGSQKEKAQLRAVKDLVLSRSCARRVLVLKDAGSLWKSGLEFEVGFVSRGSRGRRKKKKERRRPKLNREKDSVKRRTGGKRVKHRLTTDTHNSEVYSNYEDLFRVASARRRRKHESQSKKKPVKADILLKNAALFKDGIYGKPKREMTGTRVKAKASRREKRLKRKKTRAIAAVTEMGIDVDKHATVVSEVNVTKDAHCGGKQVTGGGVKKQATARHTPKPKQVTRSVKYKSAVKEEYVVVPKLKAHAFGQNTKRYYDY